MTASSAEPMFSTPRYALEASRHPASRRLVVAQQASYAAALLDDPAPTLLLCLGEALPGSVEQESLPSCEALYLRLQMLLEQAQAGTRLYVCGDESFLWHIHSLARQAGLLGDEIELFKHGTRRRVYCVHCGRRRVHLWPVPGEVVRPRAFLPTPRRLHGCLHRPG